MKTRTFTDEQVAHAKELANIALATAESAYATKPQIVLENRFFDYVMALMSTSQRYSYEKASYKGTTTECITLALQFVEHT